MDSVEISTNVSTFVDAAAAVSPDGVADADASPFAVADADNVSVIVSNANASAGADDSVLVAECSKGRDNFLQIKMWTRNLFSILNTVSRMRHMPIVVQEHL